MSQMKVRQQLSADSLSVIQRCIAAERDRLNKLHWAMLPFKPSAESLMALQEEVRKVDDAERQLSAVFLDQFEKGREENDRAGRTGLRIAA